MDLLKIGADRLSQKKLKKNKLGIPHIINRIIIKKNLKKKAIRQKLHRIQ